MADTKKELDEYKRAMEDARKQLDWCIQYLHNTQKTKVARALERNRDFIAKQIDAAGSDGE
jgi:F0F1-type ATP synthase membrane subunit b/b'